MVASNQSHSPQSHSPQSHSPQSHSPQSIQQLDTNNHSFTIAEQIKSGIDDALRSFWSSNDLALENEKLKTKIIELEKENDSLRQQYIGPIDECSTLIKTKKRILIIAGAGISTGNILYIQQQKKDQEKLTRTNFSSHLQMPAFLTSDRQTACLLIES